MPYLSREYRCLFFSAPATGSTAIISALEARGIGEYYPEADIVDGERRLVPRKHGNPAQMQKAGLITDEIRGYKWFVGVRNPFSFHVAKYLRNRTKRLRSIENPQSWINRLPEEDRRRYIATIKRQSEMNFDQFLRDVFSRYKRPQAIQEAFLDGMSSYVHQESINDDLEEICSSIGLSPPLQAERVNVTNAMPADKTYKDYYSKDLVDMVYKWNAPSFEKFPEYDFDGFHRERCRSV